MLFLILAFFNAAGMFILLGAEFIAMILVVVYVGAVAVLFLFVVMMLDVDFVELRQGMLAYLPVGSAIGLILLGELVLVLVDVVHLGRRSRFEAAPPTPGRSRTPRPSGAFCTRSTSTTSRQPVSSFLSQ